MPWMVPDSDPAMWTPMSWPPLVVGGAQRRSTIVAARDVVPGEEPAVGGDGQEVGLAVEVEVGGDEPADLRGVRYMAWPFCSWARAGAIDRAAVREHRLDVERLRAGRDEEDEGLAGAAARRSGSAPSRPRPGSLAIPPGRAGPAGTRPPRPRPSGPAARGDVRLTSMIWS